MNHSMAELQRQAAADKLHAGCFACDPVESGGLGLQFRVINESTVEATFRCGERFHGYGDRLHGGIITTLLDAAMTHGLFACGVSAVTAKLEVRFRQAVLVEEEAVVRAWLTEARSPVYRMRSVLLQSDQRRAVADAVFMELPRPIKNGPPAARPC